MNDLIKAGLKYFLYFCLLYGTLTAISLIPAVGAAFNSIYRKPTESILKGLFSKAYINLKSDPSNADVINVEFVSKKKLAEQRNRSSQLGAVQVRGKIYKLKFYNLFLSFYLFFAALMMLSPLPLKEKLIGLGVGTILFYLFTVFKVFLTLLVFFNQAENSIYQTNDFMLSIAETLLYILTLGVKVLFVIILWAALAFRKNNWKELFQTFGK